MGRIHDPPDGTTLCAFDVLAFPWPWPVNEDVEPVAMRALTVLVDHEGPKRRLVESGGRFTLPAADTVWLYVLAGLAEVLERPPWWPGSTPAAPPRAIGTRTVEPLGAAEARRLIAARGPVAEDDVDDDEAAAS